MKYIYTTAISGEEGFAAATDGEEGHDKGILKDVVQEADGLFGKIGRQCKGWTFEGEEPPENTVKSGSTLTITGQRWIPKVGGL